MAWFEVTKNGLPAAGGELDNDKAIYFSFGYREALIRSGIKFDANMTPDTHTIEHLDVDGQSVKLEVTGIN